MEKLDNRISYLRGLADGMDVGTTSREGKILTELIHLLDDMYAEVKELHVRVEETEEYVEAIDEDLEDLELLLYDDADELYETVTDCDEHELDNQYDDYYDLDDDDEAYAYENRNDDRAHLETSYQIECPSCDEVIFLHEGEDDEGYHHYVIEPYSPEAAPINPT